jgi:MinD superfamily P-loop ATPase
VARWYWENSCSVNFAYSAENSSYIDCDVEEPNGFLYFDPKKVSEKE